jgi:dihydrofolate synthase/folylpolyglutamate synthase
VLGEGEWETLARQAGAGTVAIAPGDELPRKAVELLLGRAVEAETIETRIPGRLEWRSEHELWDGAHNPAGIAWLLRHLPVASWTLVCSILADKDANSMLRSLATVSTTLVATTSSNPRALPAAELAALAEGLFETIEVIEGPRDALARGRDLAAPDGYVLATGSLYLLADLASTEEAVY